MVQTLFHDLSYRRTGGTSTMLGVFIAFCISIVFNILALAMREHERVTSSDARTVINISTSIWIFLIIFQIAMAVLLIFKQDLINVMVGTLGIEGVTTILFCSLFIKYVGLDEIDGPVALVVIFMVFLIMTMLVKFVFVCISAFSRRQFGSLLFILSVSYSGAALLFSIITFIVGANSGDASGTWSMRRSGQMLLFDYCGLGYGFVSYVIALLAVGVISFCFYRGFLQTKMTFAAGRNYGARPAYGPAPGQPVFQPGTPGIQCIVGAGQGQVIPVQGEIVLGSGRGQVNVLVNAQSVSRQHCRIWFDASRNCYHVMDLSSNGTYVNNQRIAPGVYTVCGRGSIVALADQGQQYKLL